jgi:replicative DNA helicase Mcm
VSDERGGHEEGFDEVEAFLSFLRSFRDENGNLKYRDKLEQIIASGSQSLIVDFDDLLNFSGELASHIVKNPRTSLPELEKHCRPELAAIDPVYATKLRRFNIRIKDLPERTSLRAIKSEHMNAMVSVEGIVVRSTPIKSLLLVGRFACKRCGTKQDFPQDGELLRLPSSCTDPSCGAKGSSTFELLGSESDFIDIQELRLQERPEDLPPGQLPRTAEVYVFDDMVDVARPGDRAVLTGTVVGEPETSPTGGRYRTFTLRLYCSYLMVAGLEDEAVTITPEEEQELLKISKDPWIFKKLVASLAPSIYGLEDEKEAIILQLVCGNAKELPDGVKIRGDINVFLIGDPGTAKSQLLKYVQKIAPRGLYTSGRGSTAAGLTATAVRERHGGYVLEAGALVLADRGVAAIDEFEKMRPEDRIAIHEAMEQQTCSIAKGGIVATLNARTAILAAANPALGRYDPSKLFIDNANLPPTILSRFDLIFVLKDIPDEDSDRRLAAHILNYHRGGLGGGQDVINQYMLRKYLSYCKKMRPRLTQEAADRLNDFFLEMRRLSSGGNAPMAITPRQLESLVRLSEARAKAHLRGEVLIEDAEAAIALMKRSLAQAGMDVETGQIDVDAFLTGKPKSTRDKMGKLVELVAQLEARSGSANLDELESVAEKDGIPKQDFGRLISAMLREGLLYSPDEQSVKRARR